MRLHAPVLPASAACAATRQRLLDAGGEVFAEHGFRAATVRDICARAGANIAAVSYHFRDKQGLYRAVLADTLDLAMAKYPPDAGLPPSASPKQRLHGFIRSLLFRILDKGRPTWHGRLMAQEMVESTGALDELIQRVMRPLHQMLLDILAQLSPHSSLPRRRLAAASIIAQCIFYQNARAVVRRLTPELRLEGPDLERLADHITRFSLYGLSNTAAPRTRVGRRASPRRRALGGRRR